MRKKALIAMIFAAAMLAAGCESKKNASTVSVEQEVSVETSEKEKAKEDSKKESKDDSSKDKKEDSKKEESKKDDKSEDSYKSDRDSSLVGIIASGEELTGDDAVKACNDFFKSLEGKYDDYEMAYRSINFKVETGEYYYLASSYIDSLIRARKCTKAKLDGEKSVYYIQEDVDKIYKIVDDGSVVILYRGGDYDAVENLNNHCGEFHLVDGIEMQATKLVEAVPEEDINLEKAAKEIEVGELPIERKIDISDDLKAKLESLQDDYNKVDWKVVTSPIDNIVVSEIAYKRSNTSTILVAVTNLGDSDVELWLKGYPRDVNGADLKVFEIHEKALGVGNTMVYEVNAGLKIPTGEIIWQKAEASSASGKYISWSTDSYEPGVNDSGHYILNFVLNLETDVEFKEVFSLAVDENKTCVGFGSCFINDKGTELKAHLRYPCDVFDADKVEYAVFSNPCK